MSLGKNIKKYRKELGLTQEELASVLYVTSQAVSKWESEAGLPDTAQIVPLAKALKVSTDALFGYGNENYDAAKAEAVIQEADAMRDSGNPMEGALKAADFLNEKCEEDIFNYRILMRYVQAVGHLSRFISYDEVFQNDKGKWQHYVKLAVNRGAQVIRYSDEKELVEKCHYALAWLYWHERDLKKGREHLTALPSIANNMLQETINSYYDSLEYSTDGEINLEAWRDSVRDNFQNFVRAINKQFVYASESSAWSCPMEECEDYSLWALSVMDKFIENEKMRAHCQGFYRETVKFLVTAYLRNGKIEKAAELWKKLQQKTENHLEFCEKVNALEPEEVVKQFGYKAAGNIRKYTREFADSKRDFMLGQLKNWCDGETWAAFEKLIQ